MQSKPICILGAGLMGVGIATHFARFGYDVWLYDTDSSRIAEISGVAGGITDELIVTDQFAIGEKRRSWLACTAQPRYRILPHAGY